LISRLVPDAASLDFVARRIITSQSVRTQLLRESAAIQAQTDQTLEELIAQALGKTCEPADKFFADFMPSGSEMELIKRAMALDGLPYLRICAARVFIGCSAPHFGNVLVTKTGELVSIDNCRGYFEKGEDVREMMYFIDRRSDVFKVLDGVAGLTENDIHAAVDGIPRHPACGLTSGLADYFCERLNLWKKLHADTERRALAEMEINPSLLCSSLDVCRQRLIEESAALLRV
jgi:hypothetical protein